jgi:hypothetical protein
MGPQLMVNRHIPIVANAFYTLALLLGLPSLVASLYFGFAVLRMYLASPAPRPNASAESSSVIITAVDVITRTASVVFGFLGAVGEGIARVATAVSVFVLLISLTLFITGRGLHAHAAWARWVAGLAMFLVLLVSAMLTLSAGPKGLGSLIALTITSCSLYALWALWRGFA